MTRGRADGPVTRGRPSVRRRAVLVAAVLVAAAVVVLGWRWQRAVAQRDEGLQLARAGRFADAEPLLRQAFARDRDDAEVAAALAEGKWKGGDPDAEEHLTRWCELRPGDARPYRLRMDLRHRTARGMWSKAQRQQVMEQAIDDGRRVLELRPDDEVRREVAWLLFRVGRFAEAEQLCWTCLARTPSDPWLLYLLAETCHPQGKRAEAEAALDPVVRQLPNFADALLLRAVLYREADRPDQAIPLLRRALEQDGAPRRDCLYHLGLALAATGQDEEARRVMAELDLMALQDAIAKDNFPDTPAMRVQFAEALLTAGRAEEARAKLDIILADAPDFAPAHRVMALYYERTSRPDRAAEHRRKSEGVR